MPKASKSSSTKPPTSAKVRANRAKRRHVLVVVRVTVKQEKVERSERHAGIRQAPRAGRPRTRRASRR